MPLSSQGLVCPYPHKGSNCGAPCHLRLYSASERAALESLWKRRFVAWAFSESIGKPATRLLHSAISSGACVQACLLGCVPTWLLQAFTPHEKGPKVMA